MNIFAEFVWQWDQLRPSYNWRTFHLMMIEIEDDRMCGAVEATVVIMGVGFRVRWTYDTTFIENVAEQVRDIEERLEK